MAYSATNLTSVELVGYNDDFPFLVGANKINSTSISGTPHFSPTSPDITDSSNASRPNEYMPISRVYDGLLDVPCAMKSHYSFTTPNGGNDDSWLSFKFSPGISFDTVIITGHNAVSDRFTTLEACVSNSDNYSSYSAIAGGSVPTITSNATTNTRIIDASLGSSSDPQSYSNVERFALRWTQSNEWFPPRVGELVLGKRRQLEHNPQVSWNDLDADSSVSTLSTLGGDTLNYTLNKGQSVRNAVITMSTTTEIAAVEDWWVDCNYGRDSFWWVETPKTNPTAYFMKVRNARSSFPQDFGSSVRTLTLDMVEQKPFVLWEKDLL